MDTGSPAGVAGTLTRSCSAMRVVVLDPDKEVCEALQRVLSEKPQFLVAGVSRTWSECEPLLDAFVPELFISRAGVPKEDVGSGTGFPVRIELRTSSVAPSCRHAFEVLNLPLERESVCSALRRAGTEINRRKLHDLSVLVQCYLNYSRGLRPYETTLHVEDNAVSEIPAEHVIYIAADRNHVQVHSEAGMHTIRDTMSAMTSRLDPDLFVRVHRSFIANRRHVVKVVRREEVAVGVRLSDGTELPVGPNYRAEVDQLEPPVAA